MHLLHFVLLSLLPLMVGTKKIKYKADGTSDDKHHQSPCYWNQTQTWTHPYQSITVECCDEELGHLIRKTVMEGGSNSKLGDLAKFIQRRSQLYYHMSFETIIAQRNFAISSHYHGSHSCKIYDGHQYYLVYETPVQYDPFDLKTEDYLSSIDSSDPLGSTKPANFRGDFPDIREDATAGEDLSIQPPIDNILQYPNRFAWPDPDEEVSKRILLAEQQAIQAMNELMDSVTEISVMKSDVNSTDSVNITEIELPNPTPIPRNFANLREKDRLPENTHCEEKRRDGNKCCDGRLASTMRDAMRHMATSPDFGHGKEGVIAAELQKKVQQRFKKSYEVIVSRSDFVISSWAAGQNFCKYENKGFYILAYATPKQYDIDEKDDEKKLAATSDKDPLGSNLTMFENEAPWHVELKLETSGERAGYPVGSHCSEARTGSKCCSLILFNAMKTGYDNHVATSNFDPYDIRNISKAVQWNVEEILQHSAEVIVSLDDFAYASYNNNNYTCKYRVDKYHILAYTTPNHDLDDYDEMALTKIETEPEAQIVYPTIDRTAQVPYQQTMAPVWTTPNPMPTQIYNPQQYQQKQWQQLQYTQQPMYMAPMNPMYYPQFQGYPAPQYQYPGYPQQYNPHLGNNIRRWKRQIGASPYPIHQNVYNDIGSAKPFNCPAGLSGLSGMACCDGGLQYEANKVIDQAKQMPDFDKHNTRNLAKLMTRAVQKRFGTTFESVVAQADFSWGTNKFNARTCKIDSDGYTALTYQSSSKPPPPTDFLDIPNDPTLGGPTGSSGGGGGGSGGNGGGGGGAGGGSGGSGGGGSNSGGGGGNGGGGNGGGGNGGGGNGGGGNGGGGDGQGGAGSAGNGAGGNGGGGNGGGAGDGQGGAGGAGDGAGAGGAGNGAGGAGGDFGAAAAAAAGGADSNFAAAAAAAAGSADSNAAAAAAGAGACFSLDTWVTTPTGKKRMDQIDVGDYVLTANLEETYFTPITLWIHREPEKVEEFVTIMTEYGKTLRLTSRHFMFRNKCGKSYQHYIKVLPLDAEAVYASELVLGDCVIVLYKGKYRQQRIEEITKTTRTGIYSPLTSNGRIIVNDMLASCYSEVQQNTLQTTFFWAYDRLRHKLARFFGDLYNNKIELPTGTALTHEIMQLVIPLRK